MARILAAIVALFATTATHVTSRVQSVEDCVAFVDLAQIATMLGERETIIGRLRAILLDAKPGTVVFARYALHHAVLVRVSDNRAQCIQSDGALIHWT